MTCLVVCTIYKYCSTILSDLDKLWPLKVTDDGINVGHLRNFHLVHNITNTRTFQNNQKVSCKAFIP